MDKNTLISSFGKWVAPINFSHFEKQVAATNQDKYTKKLTTMAYLKLFLYAHLHEVESLRTLSDAVLDEDFGQALGLDEISAAQLSRKNREVDPALMAHVFLHLVQQIYWHKQGKKRADLPVKIIDSSTIPLNLSRSK